MMRKIVLLVLALIYFAHGVRIQVGNDDELIRFLLRKVQNYTSWLKENHLDPSPTNNETVVLKNENLDKVKLECYTSYQFVSRHSETTNDIAFADFSFIDHFAQIGRTMRQAYEFHGYYNCEGTIPASEYDLAEDVQFNGTGKFTVAVNSSEEFVKMSNLGVTEEYKFNFTHSWPVYEIIEANLRVKNTQLKGNWSSGFNVSTFLNDVEDEFGLLYYRFLLSDDEFRNPSSKLILQYLRQTLEEVILTDIISDGANLPEPYNPTPSTTTTTTTRTTTTSKTTSSTTPEQTTRSDGTNLCVTIIMSWVILFACINFQVLWN